MGVGFGSIFDVVATLAVATITVLLIPWLRNKAANERHRRILDAVGSAVLAAEEKWRNTPGGGVVKLTYVKELLADAGYKLNDEIMSLVHAKVYELSLMK